MVHVRRKTIKGKKYYYLSNGRREMYVGAKLPKDLTHLYHKRKKRRGLFG